MELAQYLQWHFLHKADQMLNPGVGAKSMKKMQHVIQQFIHKICKALVQYSENEEHKIYCDLRKENKLIK